MSKVRESSQGASQGGDKSTVIVGNGMVGARLCERLVARNHHRGHTITVYGEESRPAYDRVRLSSYVLNREAKRLELLPEHWYRDHEIDLQTGTKVVSIDTHRREITDSKGVRRGFDKLVLATGSFPFVPPLEGSTLPGVHVYRTVADLDGICQAASGATAAAVLGGGLLGLEAARALRHLAVPQIHIVELARFLMPQQLNPDASEVLCRSIAGDGYSTHLGTRASAIRKNGRRLDVFLDSGEILEVDLMIVAAGVRPRSELAREAGIALGGRGGIRVDDCLETEVKGVFAIGECAEHRNVVYGLAAPGFQMAEILARRLGGDHRATFTGADTSTRLKMMGVDVVTLGDALQPGATSAYRTDNVYRHLTFDQKGRLSGALAVGAWPEAGQVQTAILRKQKISVRRRRLFESTGILWSAAETSSVRVWGDKAMVCNCMQVTKGKLVALAESGVGDPDRLSALTGAGTVCGSCRPLLAELAGDVATSSQGTSAARFRTLLALSTTAIFLAGLAMLFPPLPVPDSVTGTWYRVDGIWRDFAAKQWTGYTLLGLSAIGLIMSLRKRFSWFTFGNFIHWRAFHAAFGVTSLFGLFAHTGFRFGANLNFWLMFVFVGLNLLGACAGVVASLESRGTGRAAVYARHLRPSLTYAHVVLFWPFPILLGFHILSVYLY